MTQVGVVECRGKACLVFSKSLGFYRLDFLGGGIPLHRIGFQHAKTYGETVDNFFQSLFPVIIS